MHIQLVETKFQIEGTSPLVTNNQLQIKNAEKIWCEAGYFLNRLYVIKGVMPKSKEDGTYNLSRVDNFIKTAQFGFPLVAFQHAFTQAAKWTDFTLQQIKQSLLLTSDYGELACLTASPPIVDSRRMEWTKKDFNVVRPMFKEWATEFVVKYDKTRFSTEQVEEIINIAGREIGVGEERKQRSELAWGAFKVTSHKNI